MKEKKKIILLSIFVIILVTTYIGYRRYWYYKVTHVPTAEKIDLQFLPAPSYWLNYQSDYGWQVFYPPDWKVIGLPSGEEVGFLQMDPVQGTECTKVLNECSPFVTLSSYDSLDSFKKSFGPSQQLGGKNLEEVVKNLKTTQTQNKIYSDAYEITLANSKAYSFFKAEIGSNDRPVDSIVALENSGFYYQIVFNLSGAITQLSEKERSILGSLTLNNPRKLKIEEPKVTVKNWKDYENKELGFSLKIPDDWTIDKKSENKILFVDPNKQKQYEWSQFVGMWALQGTFSIQKFDSLKDYIDKTPGAREKESSYKSLKTFLENSKNNYLSDYHKTSIFGVETYEIIWIGEGAYLGYTVSKDDLIYEIFFAEHSHADQLTDIEKEILQSIQFN